MRELLKLAKGPGKTVDEVFKPDALERALNAKGDDTLRAMFNQPGQPDTVAALRNLVQDLRVMTASEGGGAGTLIAGAVAVNAFNFAMLPTLIQLGVVGSIMRRPSVVRRLAKSDAESVNFVMQAFKDALRLTPPISLGEEVIETTGEIQDFAEDKIINKLQIPDIDIGETTQELQRGIREITAPLQTSLNLPEVQNIAAPQVARRGATLLPNPRDQELAELLS